MGRSIDGISDRSFDEAGSRASSFTTQTAFGLADAGTYGRFKIDLEESSAEVLVEGDRTAYEMGKRLFDLVVATLILVVMSPVLIVLAVMVRLSSPGPILFRQERVGRHGQPFYLLKYRTMFQDADEHHHRRHTEELATNGGGQKLLIEDDPRVTKIGVFLRKWSLDELPNLLNVVKGDMSLVGPRPLVPYELALHEPGHLHRLAVQPGITGLAQVKGRLHMSMDERADIDIDYLEKRSFLFDLLLLVRTIPTLVRRPGA